MAATVSVHQFTGAGPTDDGAITNCRLNTDDTTNPGTTNPLVKPTAGVNRSFTKTVALNADTTPAGTIDNLRFFSDGTIGWTGVTLFSGTNATYTQGSGTVGTTGDDSAVATVDVATYTSGSPLAVTGSISNPSTGTIGDYVMLQADVSTSAVAGTLAQETLTFRYDET